jgi:hypothetical protein
MKLLSESATQNDQATETGQITRSITNLQPELNLTLLDSLSLPTAVSPSNANVPNEQCDYPPREMVTVWVLIAMLAVLNCCGFYALWSKGTGAW